MSRLSDNSTLKNRLCHTVVEHELLTNGAPVLLMVSGGSDSVAMARLLPVLFSKNHFFILHVNHQLRGEAANKDEAFVEQLSKQLQLPFKAQHIDVASIAAQQNDNVEQAGRKQRYSLANAELDRLCAELEVAPELGRIATAHTIDDRAETMLMRIIVGGGGGSLGSIPYRNQRVIRPLLDCQREELRAWLLEESLESVICGKEQNKDSKESKESKESKRSDGAGQFSQAGKPKLPWREDATNADTSHFRAFVRHELLPLLQTRNPKILETLVKNANVLAVESDYLDQQARALLPLDTVAFKAPLAILRRAIYLAYNQAAQQLAPDARIDFEHIDLIASKGASVGFACHLPGGIEVRNIKGQLSFLPAKPPRHRPGK